MTRENQNQPVSTYPARKTVLRLLTAHGALAGAAIRRRVKYTHRSGLEDALADLVAEGELVAEPLPRGTRYRLADPAVETPLDPPTIDSKSCARCRTNRKRPASPHCGRCLVDLAREAAT